MAEHSDADTAIRLQPATDISTAVGLAVRRHRIISDLTLRELGQKSKVSPAMISRIENGQVSPSLSTLDALAAALDVPVISLFQHTVTTADITFARNGEGLQAKRIAPGHVHDYRILGSFSNAALRFSAARVTLERKDDGTHPVYHGSGFIFLTIRDGACIYSCGNNEYEMHVGDSLTFDAQLRHGVKSTLTDTVTFDTVSARQS